MSKMKVKRYGRILDLDLTEFTDVMMQKKLVQKVVYTRHLTLTFYISSSLSIGIFLSCSILAKIPLPATSLCENVPS